MNKREHMKQAKLIAAVWIRREIESGAVIEIAENEKLSKEDAMRLWTCFQKIVDRLEREV